MKSDPLMEGAVAARDLAEALVGLAEALVAPDFGFPLVIGDWAAEFGATSLGSISAVEAHRFAAWLRAVTP